MARFNREDFRTALPQIEGYIAELEQTIKSMIASVQHGYIDATSVAANSYVDVPVTFPAAFSSTPTVVCCLFSTSVSAEIGYVSAAVHSITKTGFTCRLFNAGAYSRMPSVEWIATNK